jgi:hypothetical protein
MSEGAQGRRALWVAHKAASDQMMAALDDFEQESTPGKRADTHAAIRQFIESLRPLIGDEPAARYEASWQRFEEAAARTEQLHATMSGRRHLDPTDVAMMNEVEHEAVDSGQAFEREQIAVQALLDEVWERDQEPDA